MALIKDVYNASFYSGFVVHATAAIPGFAAETFLRDVQPPHFPGFEFKERMIHTTHIFSQSLPAGFSESAPAFTALVSRLLDAGQEEKLAYIFLPEYIARYGLEDFETATGLLCQVTQFVSAEFAVRPFLLRYFDRMLSVMTAWSLHENHKVRRLASEGSRPRLPWAMAIPELKRNPLPVLPLLENLKCDPSAWVRKSVANHLNDISKDHPDLLLRLATEWKGTSPETDAIIKHACRTLFKQGHRGILSLYALHADGLSLPGFRLEAPEVTPAQPLTFTFSIENQLNKDRELRLEYAIYHLRARGQLTRKVFKISERSLAPGQALQLTRRHAFRPITTRTYYPGLHKVALIVNGQELAELPFELKDV
ncbi:DNA alkylation repair protein [Pedobacter yulinensis]|uniref:DNA alkylation repair protein n=1 Tax=Pedobacter yulinensis TaxID=2126353 RepID=A0A2T3HPK5_9SPHI|nr:DNA alkylation repair protein [Pedobacter yulinensis]PST84337.1 DNA alkylation repair protein [Pedobacter yulinensis]